MNIEKYLPLGTVVLLKNAKKRIMITGFAATALETKGKMYDYIGCLYPEGVISSDKNLLFDHEQINKIYYMGYKDEEWKKTEIKIKEIVEKKLNLPPEKIEENKEEVKSEENMFKINTTDLFN